MLDLLFDILEIESIILWLFIGIFLIYRGIKTEIYHIIFLSIFLICSSFLYISEIFGFIFLRELMKVISIVSLVLFVKTSFYRDKRSIFFFLIFTFSIIIAIINPILSLNYGETRVTINVLYSTALILSNLWQLYACVEMSKKLKPIEIAPYIKKRYKLFGISAILFTLVGFEVIFAHTAPTLELSLIGEILVLSTGSIVTVFLAFIWVMPESMKKFLNRKYRPEYQNGMSEEVIKDNLQE